ncbi:hypothetical protein BKA66DRAFT_36179 [Pyrenochaeta sp. MPI-SDFR-AT-0127]|nr:hypothetical protein BKA66DRAFT_36179 [Pyrenochaeta sp. MPI-SDFR-AT-0127]
MKEKDYPFLDKFESAVSGTDQQVDGLFSQFNSDSRQASEWLKRQRGSNRFLKRSEENGDRANDDNSVEPECVDRLLDINPETNLLDQIQSLRDEFQLLTSILANQTNFMTDFVDNVRLEGLELYSTKQLGVIRTHLKDIDRMEHHVNAIYASITNLLDLKHRYANVFEARFARYQATDTVHQGQTIMVFTIVTIIFLPLSFIGTMFTINISDFPQGNGGEPSMSLAYVSKWVFGIGFAISIPLVVVALSYESMMRFGRERRNFLREKWKRKQRKPKKDIEEADWKNMIDGTLNVIRDFDTLAHMRDDERTVPVKTK